MPVTRQRLTTITQSESLQRSANEFPSWMTQHISFMYHVEPTSVEQSVKDLLLDVVDVLRQWLVSIMHVPNMFDLLRVCFCLPNEVNNITPLQLT